MKSSRIVQSTAGAGLAVRDRSSPQASVRGFAMLDTLMAAALLGVVMIGTMQFFSFGQSQISSLARERAAYDLARSRIEEMIADGYANSVSKTETGLKVEGQPATRTTTVTFVDDPADSSGGQDANGTQDYKSVMVDVTYGTHTVTLRTILTP